MNKKILSALLMGAFFLASTSMFVSCKDYDDDIKNLQAQIDKNTAAINAIQTKINEGAILESVTKTDNGIRIVINGQSYDITNGVDGQPGQPGTVWTIGNDGYWYRDGVKTEFKAIGTDGRDGTEWTIGADGYWYKDGKKTDYKAVGENGQPGQPGTPGGSGTTGKYYVPNPETGTFWVYGDGDKNPYDSGISYVTGGEGPISGITAVKTNDYLYLYGVEGGDGALKMVTISLSADLKGLVFVPHLYLDGIESIEYPWIGDTILRAVPLLEDWKNISHHTSEDTGRERRQDIKFYNGNNAFGQPQNGDDYRPNFLGRQLYYDGTSDGNKILTKRYVRSAADADEAHRIYWREPKWNDDEWIYGPAWEVWYHLNPSSAAVDYDANKPSFNVLEPDVVYYNTRAAASTIGVTSPKEFYELYDFTKKSGNNFANGAWRTGVAVPNTKTFRKDGSGIVYVGIQIAHPNKLAPWPTDETINPNGNTNSSESYPANQAGGNKPFAGDKTVEAYGAWNWYGKTRYDYNKNNSDNTVALQMQTATDEQVTSDYALIVPTHVQLEGLIWDKKPMYIEPKINQFAGGPGTRMGDEEGWAVDEYQNCTIVDDPKSRIHIWDTPQEAIADPDGAALELYAHDAAGIDLKPYIGVHYVRENLKKRETAPGVYNPHVFDIATLHYGEEKAWGLHYEFEFVDYEDSSNKTRDSRYASFSEWAEGVALDAPITGWNKTTSTSGIVIAKSVNAEGQTINTRSTVSVDREPLVRVMLKNDNGDVLLDGYILLHINYTPVNLTIDNYPEYSVQFNLCDPVRQFTTWSEFSKYILQDKLQGRFKVDAAMDNTGMEILSFDDYYWAVCKEGTTAVDATDAKYVTPNAFIVKDPSIVDTHMRGYELKLFNFGTDIYGNDWAGRVPQRGNATPETSNAFEDDDLGTAVYYPNGEGTTNHTFSWTLSEEELEYLTHDKKESEYPVVVTRWFSFLAKDEVRNREVNNYSAPYPYLWVKMTLKITRDMVTLKYKEKINNYWFNYQNAVDETGWSGIIFDIMAPGNAVVSTIKDKRWTNRISSTMTADGKENHFTLTKAEGKQDYCGHAKYFFAPKTYEITTRSNINGYFNSAGLATYTITPFNGGYKENGAARNRKFFAPGSSNYPATLQKSKDGNDHDYTNADTWNMLFCKYVPESSFETYKNSPINRNGDGIMHSVWGKVYDGNPDYAKGDEIAPSKYQNVNILYSEWWKHSGKTSNRLEAQKNPVNIKATHKGHKWDPAAANADIKKDSELKHYLQTCAIKYNDGVFNDTILYAYNHQSKEYTPIAKFVKYEQNRDDQTTWENAGSLELIHWLPIGSDANDAKAGKAIENLVVYDVLNALGYPMKADGTCDFANAREYINKQLRAWVGVVANNGCDVALYVEQDKYDKYNAATDDNITVNGLGKNGKVEMTYWTAKGLTQYIAAPADAHKYDPMATFLTSWERPINLRETDIDAALDANTGENTIYLLDYLKLFDWRGDYTHQGYMYTDPNTSRKENHWWFWGYYNVKGIMVDMRTSSVWTNMHQASENTYVPLNQVTTQARLYAGEPYMSNTLAMFGLGWDEYGNPKEGKNGSIDARDWKLWNYVPASEEAAIEQYMGISPRNISKLARFGSIYYENNGDNVTKFDVVIPITIFYEWGSQKYFTKWHIDTTHGRTTF